MANSPSQPVTAASQPASSGSAAGAPADLAERTSRQRRQLARRAPEFAALIVMLVALSAFFTIESADFLNWTNWLNILTAIAVTGIIAAPGTLLIISSNFDLSVGSGAAFCGVVVAVIGGTHHELGLGILLAMLAGAGIGLLNGFLVTVIGVNSLITTLGSLSIFSGLAEVLAKGQTVIINNFGGLGTARPVFNIPVPVILLVGVLLLFWLASRYTTYGRSMYAIGANPAAARLVGIRTRWAVFITFVLSGLCFGLGGLILTSQLSAASPTAATGLELQVVTAIVLGGASLTGGRGSVVGTFLGLLIIGVLNDGLILLNVGSFWQSVAQGVVLIVAVSFDRLRARFSVAAT